MRMDTSDLMHDPLCLGCPLSSETALMFKDCPRCIKQMREREESADKDLAEKIYWILIEEGQRNMKFPLGSIITNTPDEVRDIIRKHISELT